MVYVWERTSRQTQVSRAGTETHQLNVLGAPPWAHGWERGS